MESIDAILYINLKHRLDRKRHIIEEIHKFCKDDSKIHHIDAIYRNPGALGCGLSHIKALRYALDHPEWNTVLVLEDDFTFHSDSSDEINGSIRSIFKHAPRFDVGLFSYNHHYIRYVDTMNDSVKKVLFSQTTSSYMIRRHYIPDLLQNIQEATYDMERNGKTEKNCIDIYWTKIQPLGNWYALFPAIGYQYGNYSDIEGRVTGYGC
jgi:GR25 family glycosyltransferase involved in LPS biosynthesis|uniref:Glycosyltransferase n=1 Tax=viral metagenome TaxID=1070528 RepID=A0A6C0DCB6_9ZZZZ